MPNPIDRVFCSQELEGRVKEMLRTTMLEVIPCSYLGPGKIFTMVAPAVLDIPVMNPFPDLKEEWTMKWHSPRVVPPLRHVLSVVDFDEPLRFTRGELHVLRCWRKGDRLRGRDRRVLAGALRKARG